MANVKRGFRRLAWLLTVIAVPVVAVATYNASERQVGYRAVRITSDYPSLERALEANSIFIKNVGIAYFPSSMTFEQIDAQMRRLFTSKSHPEYFRVAKGFDSPEQFAQRLASKFPDKYKGQSAEEATKRVLAEYPQYRSTVDFKEFNVEPIFEKRPMWAAAVTVLVCAAIAAFLHSVISAFAWVVAGFRSSPPSAT